MNQAIKTYGVMINLDYSHKPVNECRAIWLKIVQFMLQEDFHIDKRMFLITTIQEKKCVCDKARHALNALDDSLAAYNKHSFEYITDFFVVNMRNYVDLRFPAPDTGVMIKEQYQGNIYTHQHGMA